MLAPSAVSAAGGAPWKSGRSVKQCSDDAARSWLSLLRQRGDYGASSIRGGGDRAAAALWGALLFGVGGLAALSVTVFPYWPVAHVRVYQALGLGLLAVAGVLVGIRRHTGRVLRHGLLLVGIGAVTVAVWAAGPAPQSVLPALFYAFPAVYACLYLPRRVALGYLVTIAAAYLGVLALHWRAPMGAQWAINVTAFGVPLLIIVTLIDRLSVQAWYDALTGLPNRRLADFLLAAEMAAAGRHGRPLTIAVCDLDELKRINDTRGHRAGDQLLARAGRTWAATLRAGDLLARTGGDEFLLVLPSTTADEAAQVIERMRAAAPDITFTAGIATWNGREPDYRLVHRADAALYAAKAERRGTTGIASAGGVSTVIRL